MANFRPKYTSVGQVKIYLKNKAFSSGKMSKSPFDGITSQEIIKYIVDAESRVESQLSKQYIVPFISGACFEPLPFDQAPERAQITVQNLATWKACQIILGVYFGSSEGTRGESYQKFCQEQFDEIIEQVNGKDKEGQYIDTPLAGLVLNPNASYRSDAGIPAPRTATLGRRSRDQASISRFKTPNLNRTGWNYGYPWGYW